MTPTPDEDPREPADHGVLDAGLPVETTGINLLGAPTAHVDIVMGGQDEDDADDVVMGEVDDTAAHPAAVGGADEDVVTGEIVTDTGGDAEPAEHAEPEHAAEQPSEPAQPAEPARPAEPERPVAESAAEQPAPDKPAVPATTPADTPAAQSPTTGPLRHDLRVRNAETAPGAVVRAPVGGAVAASGEQSLVSRRIGEVAESAVRETPDLLTADRLVERSRVSRPEPEGAWAHLVYSLSGGRINLGDGRRARARKELDRQIGAPLPGGARFVAVMSRKGGVGKTTVTTLLGMALASSREDRVIAVDANPDRGTLADRIARSSGKTVRDLVRERDRLRGYNDVSSIIARDETRLDVLASDTDPRVSEAFSAQEYAAVAEVAGHYYSIVLTDTGTGIVHSVAGATLDLADQIIIVTGASIDEARLASETLTWLETNGHQDKARGALVVINTSSPGSPIVRLDEIESHFRSRVHDVVRMPYDALIATGGPITYRDLQPGTREAARRLAARVVERLRGIAQGAA